ncbi:MAG: dienelactone hydrolase family protein [Planctomycetota bacterium]
MGEATSDERNVVRIEIDSARLEGSLVIPDGARGLVLFAHGSGSSRHSPRNRFVAGQLQKKGLGTLLFDLLTTEEDRIDRVTRELRFDIGLLGRRLVGATDWFLKRPESEGRTIGYFGASTGAAAALVAAAERPDVVEAVVSRGGRPDLAPDAIPRVTAPTLLIVGGRDLTVLQLNRQTLDRLTAEQKRLEVVPDATHLFEEPGALEKVADLAGDWFAQSLAPETD